MSKKIYFSLSDNEHSILHFLWRVKVASTSAIFLRFKPDFHWKEATAYKRLLILQRKKCIDTRSDGSGRVRVWSLTSKGFEAIRDKLLALKEEGYGTESIKHDLHVLAAHYGEWIPKGSAPDVRFVTEQELRRIDDADLPKWAKPLQQHKPDGVWYFPETKEKTLYALEVELSRKRQHEYEALGAFYSEETSISSVLWIVQGKANARSVVAMFKAASSNYRNIHNFVLLDDFRKLGWASEIFLGPNVGTSIHNFLEKARRHQTITTPSPSHHLVAAQKMLDFRLRRFDSNTSASARN